MTLPTIIWISPTHSVRWPQNIRLRFAHSKRGCWWLRCVKPSHSFRGLIPLGRLLNRPRLNRPSTSLQQTSITWSTGCTPLAAKIAKGKINGFHVTRDWCICMVCGMVMFYGIIYIYIVCVWSTLINHTSCSDA
jgi:hypothetical protein